MSQDGSLALSVRLNKDQVNHYILQEHQGRWWLGMSVNADDSFINLYSSSVSFNCNTISHDSCADLCILQEFMYQKIPSSCSTLSKFDVAPVLLCTSSNAIQALINNVSTAEHLLRQCVFPKERLFQSVSANFAAQTSNYTLLNFM